MTRTIERILMVTTALGLMSSSMLAQSPPSITKSFSPTTIPFGGTTTMTLTVSNPNASAISTVKYTDTLTGGLQTVSGPNFSAGCAIGTLATTSSPITVSTPTIAGNSSCTITYGVTGTTAGTITNTTSSVTSTNAGTGNPASATLVIQPPVPPSITKSFSPSTINVNGTSTITITVTNPNAGAISTVAFSDTLTGGLQVAGIPVFSSTCTGSPTFAGGTAGATSFGVSWDSIAGNTTCTAKINVKATAPGIIINTTSAVTSADAGTGNTASATLTVLAPPSVTKAFGTGLIPVGGTTSMVITITAAQALTNVSFTDTLPGGLVVATPNGLATTCTGGTETATAGTGTVSATGITFAAAGSCTVTVNVTGISAGVDTNAVTASDAVVGAGNTATATINIAAPPTIAKAFGAPQIVLLGVVPTNTTSLTFTIANPNGFPLSGIAFSDTLPSGLVVATPNGLAGSCGGGTIAAAAGGNSISLTGATLAGAGSCVFSVNVSANGIGVQVNTTSTITATGGIVGPGATATILVVFGDPTSSYQINYLPAAGAGIAGGYVDISNDGSLGADAFGPLAGTTGRICVNVYTFTADEQESECCSCLVTPNALVHLTAADLIGNPGNGVTPTLGLVVKLLATIPGPGVNTQANFTSSACNAAQTFTAANLAPGLVATATKFHNNPTASPATALSLTETPFSKQALTQGELTKLTNLCQFLSGNQSGAGLCKSCTLGGLGSDKR